jgi:hypothetical protein
MSDLFDDITDTRKKLVAHEIGKTSEGLVGKYARGVRGNDPIPAAETYIARSRTLAPDSDYVYGVDKARSGILPGPYYLGAPTIQNYGTHRPVWRGWRPKRPETDYPELGKEMMIPERNYKIESGFEIPGQKEIINMAMRNALAPYPTTPETDMIPDPYRTSFMDVRKGVAKATSSYLGIADLGLDIVTEADLYSAPAPTQSYDPISFDFPASSYPTGPNVAPGQAPVKTPAAAPSTGFDFGGIIKDITSIFVPKPSPAVRTPTSAGGVTYIMPPAQAGPALPWGTIAVAGIVGLAAIFILPKVLK